MRAEQASEAPAKTRFLVHALERIDERRTDVVPTRVGDRQSSRQTLPRQRIQWYTMQPPARCGPGSAGLKGTMMSRSRRRLTTAVLMSTVAGAMTALAATAIVAFACTNTAAITVTGQAASGSVVTGLGSGFSTAGGSSPAYIHFNASTGSVVWSGAVSPSGHFKYSFTVPQVAPGSYYVAATQNDASGQQIASNTARASIYVRAATAPLPPSAPLAPVPVAAGPRTLQVIQVIGPAHAQKQSATGKASASAVQGAILPARAIAPGLIRSDGGDMVSGVELTTPHQVALGPTSPEQRSPNPMLVLAFALVVGSMSLAIVLAPVVILRRNQPATARRRR